MKVCTEYYSTETSASSPKILNVYCCILKVFVAILKGDKRIYLNKHEMTQYGAFFSKPEPQLKTL